MTTAERQEAEDTLRTYISELDHAALTRVVTAERWCTGALKSYSARCLVGHATGPGKGCGAVGNAFDALCHDQGIARTVSAIQLLAATLLRDRETASLRALLGEENHSHA